MARFATPVDGSGAVKLLSLRVVSGSMLFYAAGVAAVAARRYDLLGRLFALRRPNPYTDGFEPLAACLDTTVGYSGPDTHIRLFTALTRVIEEALAVGTAAAEDAWQVFELARLMWATVAHERFSGLQEQYDTSDVAFRTADAAVTAAKAGSGGNLATATAARSKAWQDRDRLLGQIGRSVSSDRPHILTRTSAVTRTTGASSPADPFKTSPPSTPRTRSSPVGWFRTSAVRDSR